MRIEFVRLHTFTPHYHLPGDFAEVVVQPTEVLAGHGDKPPEPVATRNADGRWVPPPPAPGDPDYEEYDPDGYDAVAVKAPPPPAAVPFDPAVHGTTTVRGAAGAVTYVWAKPPAEYRVIGVLAGDHVGPLPLPGPPLAVTDGQGRYLDPAAAFPGDLTHLPENSTLEQSQTDKAWHDPAFGGGPPAPPQ